jgi:hypothetical protein
MVFLLSELELKLLVEQLESFVETDKDDTIEHSCHKTELRLRS